MTTAPQEELKEVESSVLAVVVRSRPLVLLFVLLLEIVISPMIHGDNVKTWMSIAVILATLNMAADTRRHFLVGLALAIPATTLLLLADQAGNPVMDLWAYPVILALYLYVIYLMLRRIFHSKIITVDTIGAALCTYVLLGVLWILFYAPILRYDPDSFVFANLPEGAEPASMLSYFSFVTLTTLGYGDVAPVTPLARGLAMTEAITGTLFLAVLISRLVGSYGRDRSRS